VADCFFQTAMADSQSLLPTDRLPLLITGIAGVAGYNALAYFQSRYPQQVFGLRQRDNRRLSGEGILAGDLEDRARLVELFERHRFRSVLNCAGNCALRACEVDTRLAWRTNVEGLIALLSVIAQRDVRLVHLSIDLVFSGKGHGSHREGDRTDPVTVYGTTMVAGEQLILDWLPGAAILRISLPMGVSFNGHAGAIDWIQSRFRKSKPATLYYDEIRTPTYTDCLNEVSESVLANNVAGLYHAGGPVRLSLYQIAQIINRVGGYDADLLMGCWRRQAGPVPPRAGNVSLDSRRLATALGRPPLDPWPHDPRWLPTHRDWHRERSGLPGSPQLLAEILYRNPRKVAAVPDGGPNTQRRRTSRSAGSLSSHPRAVDT